MLKNEWKATSQMKLTLEFYHFEHYTIHVTKVRHKYTNHKLYKQTKT